MTSAEPAYAVELKAYVGEDWTFQLTFYDDAPSDPQTTNDPLAIAVPVMGIRPAGRSPLTAYLDESGTFAGTLAVSGGASNVLTITVPNANTWVFEGSEQYVFDIFAKAGGQEDSPRLAIVKSGQLTVYPSITPQTPPVGP